MGCYVADFETSYNQNNNTTHVWAYSVCDVDTLEIVSRGTSLEQFYNFMCGLERSTIYFHNLKFDGSYIVNKLSEKGYKAVTGRKVGVLEYGSIIADSKIWYGLDVHVPGYTKGGKLKKKGTRIKILDSLKKISMPVAKIAKAYGLTISKGDCDHSIYRPIGYLPTEQEWEYVDRDVLVVATALQKQFNNGLTKSTSSADTLALYKQKIGADVFAVQFPKLSPVSDSLIRKSYRGGIVWNNPTYQYQDIDGLAGVLNYNAGCGRVYDVNSLYPYVMYDCVLPYGKPQYFMGEYEQDETMPLYVQEFEAMLFLKPDHIPTLQENNARFGVTKFITNTDEPVRLVLTNVDMERMHKHYDVEIISFIGGYKFKGKKGMFQEYLDEHREVKENPNSSKELVTIAKLMMNSLYGKFGARVDRTNVLPYIEHGIMKFEEQETEIIDGVYIPMATFITAYARNHLFNTAQANYNVVAYIDTDSIHVIGNNPIDIDEHQKRFGAWKQENTFTRSRYVHAKTYYEEDEAPGGEVVIKCCGMPDTIKENQVTWENFLNGSTFTGKLMPKQVIGGQILVETTFTIK